MAIVYGEVDSLKKMIFLLRRQGITHLSSLDDIFSYKDTCEEKVEEARRLAGQEHQKRLDLQQEKISKLLSKKENRFLKIILFRLRLSLLRRKLKKLEGNSEDIVQKKTILNAGSFYYTKVLLDDNYNLLVGAQGEEKAVRELKKLPDSFTVINNFELRLNKPIYNRRTGQRIYSAQADHLVIGPSGLFLIETKNWSKFTLENSTDFTPIDQVKRTSFALFCYLNPRKKGIFSLLSRPQKISVRSILLMTNATTEQKDPFVKVLNLSRLNGYISWFPPVLSNKEVERIISKLM